MKTDKHSDIVRDEFNRQAATFSQLKSISNPENVKWILDNMPLEAQYQVLDVAAGTGAQSRVMAPRVQQVTAVDLTPAMLIQAQRETVASNIRFEQGFAERLPHARNRFDLAVN